ncbi:hypothetical protein NPIL_657921 [Nephila pilipes]|uniref:Uncharacterized protein n=1 Tax=Nephila pilipes TaxID=299642 RepID=A0A8X6QFK3_NEPPI|nr:hypothetical protein NPIL_657921 [Nephila pilipes]
MVTVKRIAISKMLFAIRFAVKIIMTFFLRFHSCRAHLLVHRDEPQFGNAGEIPHMIAPNYKDMYHALGCDDIYLLTCREIEDDPQR